MGRSNEEDVSSAADCSSDVLLLLLRSRLSAVPNFVKGILALGAFYEFVDPLEGLVQSLLELTVFVRSTSHQLLSEDVCDVAADFEA